MQADVGDRVVINLKNDLKTQYTSLHFHGLFQQGTNSMDGPPGVVSCEVAPGESFTYDFMVRIARPPNMHLANIDPRSTNPAHTGITVTQYE